MYLKKVGLLMLPVLLIACGNKEYSKEELKTNNQKVSYTYGYSLGENLKNQLQDIDSKIFISAIQDAIKGKENLFNKDEVAQIANEFQSKQQEKFNKEKTELSKENLEEANKFLAENKTKEGVISLDNGLQYQIIKQGKGSKPKKDSIVKVNYEGKLIDGNIFDSSYQRNKPAEFNLSQVIPGWTAILQLMPVGSKWTVYIPPQLAYGEQGAGNTIPPNSLLIFDIELLDIIKKSNKK